MNVTWIVQLKERYKHDKQINEWVNIGDTETCPGSSCLGQWRRETDSQPAEEHCHLLVHHWTPPSQCYSSHVCWFFLEMQFNNQFQYESLIILWSHLVVLWPATLWLLMQSQVQGIHCEVEWVNYDNLIMEWSLVSVDKEIPICYNNLL